MKPRVAFFDFACCEGCQLSIVNLEEKIIDLVTAVDVVEFREAISDHSDQYDIAFIEGSITRPQDEERIKKIRSIAKILIAYGACATTGGVNALKNNFSFQEVRNCVYGKDAQMPHLKTGKTKAVDEVVTVDYYIYGCPVNKEETVRIVQSLLLGKKPEIPNYPVCVECKMREAECAYFRGETCLGPITRAGCGAVCPGHGFYCFGCRGYVDHPQKNAAIEVLKEHGYTLEDALKKFRMFGFNQEIKEIS